MSVQLENSSILETTANPVLKVQINAFDSYSINYTGEKYDKVPVIRIFGRTNTHSNVLVHVHGVFPYFVIKRISHGNDDNIEADCLMLHKNLEDLMWDFYTKKKTHESESESDIDEELNSVEDEVDAFQVDENVKKKKKKRNRKITKNVKETDEIDRAKTMKYIAKVEPIKGREFYGYYEEYECFYKVSLLRPNSLNRIVDLLNRKENIHVMPHFNDQDNIKVLEAHLPFFLQFCIDYNLHGCSWLSLKKFSYRLPIFKEDAADIFSDDEFLSIAKNFQYNSLRRIGKSLIEIDINPEDIANAEELLLLPSDDPKDAISSTKAVWDSLNIIRAKVGLEVYKSSQSQGNVIKSTDFNHLNHEIIRNSYESLIEKDKKKKFKHNALQAAFENLPTLLESNLKRNRNQLPLSQKSGVLCSNTPSEKPIGITEINKKQKIKGTSIFSFTQSQVSVSEKSLKPNTILTFNNIEESLEELGLKRHDYDFPSFQDPLQFSSFKDRKQINSKAALIKCWEPSFKNKISFKDENLLESNSTLTASSILEYMHKPPTYNEIFLDDSFQKKNPISNVNLYGSFFQSQSQNIISKEWEHKHKLMQNKMSMHSNNNQTTLNLPISNMFMELTTATSMIGKLPNPDEDEILMICWSFVNGDVGDLEHTKGIFTKLIEDSEEQKLFWNQMTKKHKRHFEVVFYENEVDLILKFAEFVAIVDPDILTGFEVHNDSWGFLLNRSEVLGYDLATVLSRVSSLHLNKMGDFWGYTHASSIRITGRHMINLWRVLKKESKLESFTLENFVYHLLHKRIPKFSADYLFENWTNRNYKALINYGIIKIQVCVEMVDNLSIVQKIAEQARITGVDFYSVIYRGSQYKVESLLSRICRRENYLMYSPSQKNVRTQKPLESIALIMEPDSQMYIDPLVVLDFQSLYPSIMIAFNICYSTLLGDTSLLQKNNVMLGADKNYHFKDGLIHEIGLKNLLLTTNGSLFVNQHKRKGILAKMLNNLLETRVMIKNTMSDLKMKNLNSNFDTLLRDLEGMQLALKFVLNVTYGYTAASHSGRMPLQELADSVVEMGRTVLTQSIHCINNSTKWGAKVVYTDTDSLFILFPGKTREVAFEYGREIARTITENNLAPIKLKFEKLYHPCILVTKKRYVGNMYETESVKEPILQAKGLEIIRRDGTPLLQKLMETSVKLLFDTCNITVVQNFITREFEKLFKEKYLVQDLCFSRKVKLGHYKRENSLPPAAYLAKEIMDEDSRAEAQYKQTVRYVVVKKENPKALLREKAMTPTDFMLDKKRLNLQLDMEYYILKHLIPPLNRIYNLIGIDCQPWFEDVKKKFSNDSDTSFKNKKTNSVSLSKVTVKYCEHCQEIRVLPSSKLCFKCLKNYDVFIKNDRKNLKEIMKKEVLNNVCESCIGYDNKSMVGNCVSQDCPVYYQRNGN